MSAVIDVMPKNVATFKAIRMEGDESVEEITRLAENLRAKVDGWVLTRRKGQPVEVFRLTAANRRKYDLAVGDWLVFLGTNGSLRVCTDREFKMYYTPTERGI